MLHYSAINTSSPLIQAPSPNNLIPIIFGICIASFIFYFYFKGRRKQGGGDQSFGTAAEIEGISRLDRMKREIDELFVQIQEAAGDYVSRLDTKIKLAQGILAEIDKGREELKQLIKEMERAKNLPEQKEKPQQKEQKTINPLHQKVLDLSKNNMSIRDIATEVGLTEGETELIIGHNRGMG